MLQTEVLLKTLRPLLDDADGALDDETYEQKRKDGFDPPDDAEYTVTVGTLRKINHLFSALDAVLTLQEQPERKTENASI